MTKTMTFEELWNAITPDEDTLALAANATCQAIFSAAAADHNTLLEWAQTHPHANDAWNDIYNNLDDDDDADWFAIARQGYRYTLTADLFLQALIERHHAK